MAANQVRIIAGRHRGRRLRFIPGRSLRPTPDRVRETLFNWLRADLADARCLDLFAGTGALGLEAISRGAGHLCAIEQNRKAAQCLRDNIALLGEQARAEVHQADVLRYLQRPSAQAFDIVFADPPFADSVLSRVCDLLESGQWLTSTAVVYLEQDVHRPRPDLPSSWALDREAKAGQSAQYLLRRNMTG